MAERKKPRRRITRGDSFTFVRDDRTGETSVRCLFCAATYDYREHWNHICPKPTEESA
jgi:hypothetical protein